MQHERVKVLPAIERLTMFSAQASGSHISMIVSNPMGPNIRRSKLAHRWVEAQRGRWHEPARQGTAAPYRDEVDVSHQAFIVSG
jgi:hypothetical protein